MLDDTNHLLANRYLIKEKLSGEGASGYVYLAKDITKEDGNNLYAIKELNPHTSNSEAYRIFCERFKDEEIYLRALNGFNSQIPKFYGSFSVTDEAGKETYYIVQEYIEGKTLSYKLKEERVLSESKVKEILIALLPVIAHIHSEGFIHRDINPANIILRSQNDLPVLIDFGAVKDVARTIVASVEDTDYRTLIIGKDGYMAPEHLDGQPEFRSDLYSLGVTAIELLSGLKPKKILRDLSTRKLLWRSYDTNISQDFVAVIDKATQESVELRYSDAQAMLKAVESVAVSESDDAIKKRLGDLLSSLSERQPKTPPENYKKCYTRDCNFYVTLENKYCPNCGAYNVYQLSKRGFHLMHNGAEAHLEWITPDYSKRWVIRLGKYILKDCEIFNTGNFYIGGSLIAIGIIIGAIAGWSIGEGFFDTIGSVIGGVIVGPICGLLLLGIIWLLGKLALIKYEALLAELEEKKATINRKVRNLTRDNQRLPSYLNYIEKEIAERKASIAAEEKNRQERLLNIQSAIKERIGTSRLQKEEEKFQLALAESKQKYKKYQVKLQEIKLLRLYNQLQAKVNQSTINDEIEKELMYLNKLIDGMYDTLKETNIVNSVSGKRWIARIVRAREILAESVTLLITHRDELYLTNQVNANANSPEEFGQNLNLLSAYITYRDFYEEYKALQSEKQ